jgi:hypothetical protein
MNATRLSCGLVVCLLAGAGGADAAVPRIVNGKVATRAAGVSLSADANAIAASAKGVVWMGYDVPANAAGAESCCGGFRDGGAGRCGCRLESGSGVRTEGEASPGHASLERSSSVAVFVRFEAGAAGRVAPYSTDCEIDAGGRPVVWFTGVKPAESIAWLESLATAAGVREVQAPFPGRPERDRLGDGALTAIAFHADASADRAIERIALAPGSPQSQRTAVFWMGAARERAGFEGLRRVLAQSADDKVREQVTFAFSISKESDAVPALFDVAKNDRSPHVRGQALFWLGQKAGTKVAATISQAAASDPDTEVKKRAVFALSQLPKDEGVPRLIEVARTNRSIEVRKQAMFWLGQSKDARALAFFEEVLAR